VSRRYYRRYRRRGPRVYLRSGCGPVGCSMPLAAAVAVVVFAALMWLS
jgi:hypothetical protein